MANLNNQVPTLRELNEAKVGVRVWLPPVVKQHLQELSEQDGVAMSARLGAMATELAFPALSGEGQRAYAQAMMDQIEGAK